MQENSLDTEGLALVKWRRHAQIFDGGFFGQKQSPRESDSAGALKLGMPTLDVFCARTQDL